jgi:hypothetical protein
MIEFKTVAKYALVFSLGVGVTFGGLAIKESSSKGKYDLITKKDLDLAIKYGYKDTGRGFFTLYKENVLHVYTYRFCKRVTADVRNVYQHKPIYIYKDGDLYSAPERVLYTETLNVLPGQTLVFISVNDISNQVTCEEN